MQRTLNFKNWAHIKTTYDCTSNMKIVATTLDFEMVVKESRMKVLRSSMSSIEDVLENQDHACLCLRLEKPKSCIIPQVT